MVVRRWPREGPWEDSGSFSNVVRLRLAATVPSKPWLETTGEYACRLRRVVDDINVNLDVEGLCKGLLKRLDLVIEAKGGRIPK